MDEQDPVDAIAAAWRRERPGTPVSSIGVVTRMWHAAKLLGDDRTRLLRGEGADAATLDLLSTLRRAGRPYRMTTRELADAALITAGAVTQRVDRAVAQGLVVRAPHKPRSRQVDVELTEAGHTLVERLVDAVLHREVALLATLNDDEQTQIAGLLHKLLIGLGDTGRPGHVGA